MSDRDRDRDRDRDMDRNGGGYDDGFDSSDDRRSGGRREGRRFRVCPFCADGTHRVNYLDAEMLRRYVTEEGKIRPRRQTSVCAKHQRSLARAVKRARHLALLPFTGRHVQES